MTTNPWSHFIRHYLEMVAAMVAGMAVLWGIGAGISAIAGLEYSLPPELAALKMAFDMSAGMAAWMRYRGHGWSGIGEMVAAMFAPAIVLVPLSWLSVISAEAVMLATHVLMLPLMLVVMLRRRGEYA
ncbi:hypothetical protein AB0M20_11980 [Actinoplanes sp. NPDC051633]|uniref:hypothetical protein n=1 Tax=Actinoplanes sp. NPDC051633 TaxID=3155670 RepID=UPI0034425E58